MTKIIDHRYRILATVGSGLSGEVYRVRGPEGLAALKLLKSAGSGLDPEGAIAAFKFEFSLLKDLSHPNVVKIFDFGFDEHLKRFYFTQEWIEGRSIKEAVLSLEDLQRLFVQALQGLAYLHGQEIIHGDIKPENLLISHQDPQAPRLKLIDFGLSHPGFVQRAGTPATMAPEKILKEPIDARSDLYSLAVVFFTLITGKNPFLRDRVPETLDAHLRLIPPAASSLRPQLDPVWSELLAEMLKKNPRHRIPSAEACLKFLETRGEVDFEFERPALLPQTWIGRPEILKEGCDFLDEIKKEKDSRKILAVVGEAGLGQDNLLTELKYEAELRGLEVIAPEETPQRHPAVIFLKSNQIQEPSHQDGLRQLAKKASLILALQSDGRKVFKPLGRDPDRTIQLRPLSREETAQYLREVTRNPDIPGPFLNTLYRLTLGRPQQLKEALLHLMKDPKMVDAAGKWRLAVFQEAEPNLEQLGLSGSALELAEKRLEDPLQRWELQLKRSVILTQQGKAEQAFVLLKDLESQANRLVKGSEKLVKRARLLEKRGWIYTKQNRYGEAREAYGTALSVLAECGNPQPVLQIRLKNFIAYLDLQAGKNEEAIAQFKECARLAEALPPEQQKQITNNELGSAYLAAGRLQEAIERLREDLKFFSQTPEAFLRIKAHYNLAEAYFRNGNLPAAFESYQQVAWLARKERQWDYLVRAYNGLGNTANLQANRTEALDYYQRSLALAEYLKDYLSATTVAQNRGVLLGELGRYPEALHDLEISKRLIGKLPPSSHSRYLMARATLELGEIFLKQRDFLKAKTLFSEALNRAEEDPNLKSFRFYPLISMAKLALEENDTASFRELHPKLAHLAQSEEEKRILAELTEKTSQDPTVGRESEVESSLSPRATTGFPAEALPSLLKINRGLLTEHDPEALLPKILEYATDLSGAESALLLEVDEHNHLSQRSSFNTPGGVEEQEISHHVAKRVLESGKSLATHDALGDREYNQFESVVELHLRSIACVPIRLHQKVIGLLYLTHRNKTNLFNRNILNVLEAFADQAALALQNARQFYQLRALTGQLEYQLENANDFIDRLQTDLRGRVKNPYPDILGKSRQLVEILQNLDRISDTQLTVLILGETGTGKELVARSIHENSRRRKAPFVAVNCGAIPENLIESELFGYVAGAFTGANRNKAGLLEEAGGGTLFLDEVAELPPNLQVKFLRALQDKEIRRLGSNQNIPVDIRVVAATHRDLDQWVKEGRFREDLYYRLAQMILKVPALRDRMEDLPLLAEAFLSRSAQEMGLKNPPRLGRDLLQWMMQYPWPGNVRELENMIRTASAFAERGVIHLENLPAFLREKLEKPKDRERPTASPNAGEERVGHGAAPGELPYFPHWTLERYEEALYAKSYLRHQQDCEKVARELGVGIATVYVKIRKFGLKEKLAQWQAADLVFPPDLSLSELKIRLIKRAHQDNGQSPYQVAKQLGINVGTVYRYLKESAS